MSKETKKLSLDERLTMMMVYASMNRSITTLRHTEVQSEEHKQLVEQRVQEIATHMAMIDERIDIELVGRQEEINKLLHKIHQESPMAAASRARVESSLQGDGKAS